MNTDSISSSENRLRRRARQYIDSDLMAAAQTTLESLLQRAPRDVPSRIELAGVMLKQGQLRAATRQLLQAVPMLPDDAALITQLAWRLSRNGEILAARACLDHPVLARGTSAPALAERAHLRWMLGEIPVALALMERAMAAGIDTAGEYLLHAMLLQFTGDMAQADKVLATCLDRWPDFGDAVVVLANLRKQTPENNHLDFLRARLQRMPADNQGRSGMLVRAEFESALFKELDDLGRHDEAQSALARSNAIMHALNPYDAAGEAAIVDAIIRAAASDSAAATGPEINADGPVPIFIVGLPRSGTTLLDRMLSSHSQVTSAGEINDFMSQLRWTADVPPGGLPSMLKLIQRSPNLEFAELGARYLKQTQWRARGRRFYIDKLPGNIRVVNLIRRALPHAPILHMVREPMDVCFSNFKAMFGNASPYSYDMQALGHYYKQYARLAGHWHATIPDAMLDVPYASLVGDPEASLRRVLEYCGMAMEEGCLRPERNAAAVATRSSAQVLEPIHTRNIGQWRQYATYLKPLQQALG
jgi:tetratricopeptide (TPR) repeat protein